MRRRRKKRTFQALLMLFSLITLIVFGYIAYREMKPRVIKTITLEAGSSMVDVQEFMIDKDIQGQLITNMQYIDLNTPGVYEIKIKVENKIHTSYLEIVDNTAPLAETVDILALMGEEVKPEDFVIRVEDVTPVTISYVNVPDTEVAGTYEISLLLEDTSRNSLRQTAKLTVLDIKSFVQVEVGSMVEEILEDYAEQSSYEISFVTDITQLDTSKPATHEIQLNVDGRILTSYIEVVDTTPPKANIVDMVTWKDEVVEAKDFVKDIEDVSEVSIVYKETPVFNVLGDQKVSILLKDRYGNATELEAMLTVMEDKEPPVFTGVQNKTVYVGEAVSYKKGVSVSDNRDKDLSFQVDSSKVNLNKEGVYKVYYSTVDSSGNQAEDTSTITVEVFSVTDEKLNELIDPIINRIIDDSMTKREQAYEIYKYIKGHVAYTGDSDKSDTKAEAFRGIKNAVGDCFTYYAVAEVMLTRVGIDNMRVTRVGGKTQHFWNLIDCGDGWYHFDSCPNKDKMETFMMTDAEVEAYTEQRGNNYYNFDKSLHPSTPL